MVDYGWGPVTEGTPGVQQYVTTQKKTDPAATMAFLLSLLGIFTWSLSCIVALFLAPRAKRNIAVSPETRKGKGLALAAQVISGWTLIAVIATIAVIARP
jgi:hypothetical protein